MDALEYRPLENKIYLVKKLKPTIKLPHDILIRVLVAGISKTDVHIVNDLLPCAVEEPFTLGQEFIGVVTEIGKNVSTVNVNDKVVVNPNSGCGICMSCRKGDPHYCLKTTNTLGLFKDGGWAQFAVITESQVYKIPPLLTFCQAVFTEPMSRIIHGWDLLIQIPIANKILIAGCGITGILWASVLHYRGYRNVTISEPNLARVEILEKMELNFESLTPDLLKAKRKNDRNLLFDLIIDTTRSASAIAYHIFMLTMGGRICIFGGEPDDVFVSVSPYHILKNEIKIIGANMSTFHYEKALTLLQSMGDRYFDFENLCVKVYELKDYKDAIKHVRKGCVVKAVYSIGMQCLCKKWEEKELERKKEAAAAALAALKQKIKQLSFDC